MQEFINDAQKYFPEILWRGIIISLPIALISFFVGLIIAVFVAIIRINARKNFVVGNPKKPSFLILIFNQIINFYVWFFRSTPLIVQLFVAFYGLPDIFGGPWFAAIAVLALNTGAYASESIRGAILSVDKEQFMAGASLGMPRSKIFEKIILPQAAVAALPPLSNTFISLVKDTALVSLVTIVDPFLFAQQVAASNFHVFNMYILVAIMYALIVTILNLIQNYLEKIIQSN